VHNLLFELKNFRPQILHRVLLLLFLTLFLEGLFFAACFFLKAGPVAYGLPAATVDKSERLLIFPQNESVGKLAVLEKKFGVTDRHLSGKPYRECLATFKVPTNLTLLLVANDCFAQYGDFLAKLPPDAFAAATFEKTTMADEQMTALGHLTGLRYLVLDSTETTDAGMAKLAGLTALEFLDMSHTLIKGQCLAKFGGMKKLQYIDLNANDLDPQCLNALLALPQLKEVHLGKDHLHDDDLAIVAKLKALTHLSLLDNHDLTDRGLKQLGASKHLTWMDLRGTKITGKGILALKGLPLTGLKMGSTAVTVAEDKAIQACFPGIGLTVDNRPTSIPQEIFAPLH
jgi:hypothetical protein